MSPQTSVMSAPMTARSPFLLLTEFSEHLKQEGVSGDRIRRLEDKARHLLVWLELHDLGVEAIDDAILQIFRHHDCRCVAPARGSYKKKERRSREFMSGVHLFVRFLENSGRTPHLNELDDGLRLLNDLLQRRSAEGYSQETLRGFKNVCCHFLVWLHRCRIPMKDIDAKVLVQFYNHDCLCPGYNRFTRRSVGGNYVSSIKDFEKFLIEQGVIARATKPRKHEYSSELDAFSEWLRQHRGNAEKSIRTRLVEVSILLADLGHDASRYDAVLIRDALLRRFAKGSHARANSAATSMRMYLRFLASTGKCSSALVGAVPSAPNWQLADLPKYIPAEDIERVIAACDTSKPSGVRDKAILLLLARLALRAGDVSGLRLSDIAWNKSLVYVCGKSRRAVGLPLPQDVGNALLEYIEHVRPKIHEEKVFLRIKAPYRPFSSSSVVSNIVHNALERAGLEDAHPRGAYLFRHSTATSLLRSGTPLESISALLRHTSPETTAIYAKVDVPMLKMVAQPWIGGV